MASDKTNRTDPLVDSFRLSGSIEGPHYVEPIEHSVDLGKVKWGPVQPFRYTLPTIRRDDQSPPAYDTARPPHYVNGGVEPKDLFKSLGIWRPACQANIIKYVSRYDRKGEALKDLKKAKQYLEWLIEEVESDQ